MTSSEPPPPMSRRPVGTLREHDGRGFGVVPKPLAANRPFSLRHCSPPFIMMRTSFAGCRLRSLFTCSVVSTDALSCQDDTAHTVLANVSPYLTEI